MPQTEIETTAEHCKYVQDVYDNLPDSLKIEIRRYAPFDRIHLKRIGIPSAVASVYDVDGYGELVVKLNKYSDSTHTVMASNNSAIDNELRKYYHEINNNPDFAKISVTQHKVIHKNYVITFERKMEGITLHEYVLGYELNAEKMKNIFIKIKNTLGFLYSKIGFIHHDLHCGNVFLQYDLRPIIFDFDWGVAIKSEQMLRSPASSQASNQESSRASNQQNGSPMSINGSSSSPASSQASNQQNGSPMNVNGSSSSQVSSQASNQQNGGSPMSISSSDGSPMSNITQPQQSTDLSTELSTTYSYKNFTDMQNIFNSFISSKRLSNSNSHLDNLINYSISNVSPDCINIKKLKLWWYIINKYYSPYSNQHNEEKYKRCDMTLLIFNFVWICCWNNISIPTIGVSANNLLTLQDSS
jgi:hypothetical protein